ncbi:MAG: OmpA family protein [candidate division Zixibacteria bacterium]|jgi:outer membrane protein OmpA-like peptidoglycan-associated protein|nr:OmpA family protein [candidate division Zixibacteria bacterium]
MKTLIALSLALMLLAVGCGVNKDYVSEQIAQSEARTGSRISEVAQKADANAAEVDRLKSLAAQLEEKADMAINKASGFENYQIIWEGTIHFDFDQYAINDVAAGILDEAGAKMEAYPGSVIEIAGFTDRTGSARYNLVLGEMRAMAAKKHLAERFGISLYRMFTVSYGQDKPAAMPDERDAHSKNRRVTLTVWGNLGAN